MFILLLILLKFASQFTSYKMKGLQVKLFGSLVLCQSLLLHQRMEYKSLWYDFHFSNLLDALVVISLFTLAIFNLIRLNHYMPESCKGEYQLIAQKVLD